MKWDPKICKSEKRSFVQIYLFRSLLCFFHDSISWAIQVRFYCIYFENYLLKQRDKHKGVKIGSFLR